MSATEIKFGGFGGQGVILAGIIIGRAASIYNNKFATLTQSFGPEARGSACSAQVIVSEREDSVSVRYQARNSPGHVSGSLQQIPARNDG